LKYLLQKYHKTTIFLFHIFSWALVSFWLGVL
jgi:hypothetical protein